MLDANVSRLIRRYRFKGLLLDTNLLLLLVIGHYRLERIATFKRTAKYSIDDYRLLLAVTSPFDRRVTTPNILTEVDNLGRQLPAQEHDGFAVALRDIVTTSIEIARPSLQIMELHPFAQLGLADALSMSLASECLIASDDLSLYAQIVNAGRDAINFNHLRS